MKTLIPCSVLVLGLAFAGSAQANTLAYNSKTTQNVAAVSSTGEAFTVTNQNSKAGSGLVGPTQEQAGKTNLRMVCSHRDEMSPETCGRHCSPA